MADLTPTLRNLLQSKPNAPRLSKGYFSTETADEFLKEAYRINTHITTLLAYLHRIRPAYLSINNHHQTHNKPPSPSPLPHPQPPNISSPSIPSPKELKETDQTAIDTSTSALLHQLSTAISTLSSAETLRQDTQAQLLHKKYHRGGYWTRWAAGDDPTENNAGKSDEQRAQEAAEENTKQVRGAVIWFLREHLQTAVAVQRGMVEKRVERVRERERSVLYLSQQSHLGSGGPGGGVAAGAGSKAGARAGARAEGKRSWDSTGTGMMLAPRETQGQKLQQTELDAIEAELTPEQLQLFAEENDHMVKYYEDTLSKVRNAEKSLLEISSLQQTLVAHLSTQEEYINQLVTDASNTQTNIGQGNKELKRASERRSTAQAVFWGTVGLCTWLVVWDLVF